MHTALLTLKISNPDYQNLITKHSSGFSKAEHQLLAEILSGFDFDVVQAQALAQAVIQQARFDPNAQHIEEYDDEDVTSICAHCLNPPVPPLRDYLMWREKTAL